MKEHILIGKTITKIMIAEDKKAILFITTEGDIKALCDAECCSHTWIENIELPVNGFPATVLSVDNLEMPDLGSPDDYDVIAYYGFKITTDKGDIIIDYRNSSNGYYGGDLIFPSIDTEEYEHFYGGVFEQNISKEEWKEIE